LAHDLQSEARNYRGGQTRNVTRIDLVAPDTIDAEIVTALAEKKAHAEDILDAKKAAFTKDELAKLLYKGRK
jgi:SNF2 family DNA or RNA helicase